MSQAVVNLLQARFADLDGVTTAPTIYPDVLPESELPCFITDMGEAETQWEAYEGDLATERRWYLFRCLVQEGGLDTVNATKRRAMDILDAMLLDLRTEPALAEGVAILIDRAGSIRDSGIRPTNTLTPVRYGNVDYIGFDGRVLVEERYE